MTNFDRIKNYYTVFDEKHRLDKAEGRLEYEISLKLLFQYIPISFRILDLGGGAGKYSIELAKRGNRVTIADLSEKLLSQAKSDAAKQKVGKLESFDLVNAIDLSIYEANSFDTVILFGPLYHLLDEKERESCILEISRILKPNGLVFASFIPYLSGAFGIIDRLFFAPEQVSLEGLLHTFKTGQFQNNANIGFQEGYYPHYLEIEKLFDKFNFKKIIMRSIRSFGYGREEEILSLKQENKNLYDTLMQLIDSTSEDPSVIETCGHVIYLSKLTE